MISFDCSDPTLDSRQYQPPMIPQALQFKYRPKSRPFFIFYIRNLQSPMPRRGIRRVHEMQGLSGEGDAVDASLFFVPWGVNEEIFLKCNQKGV